MIMEGLLVIKTENPLEPHRERHRAESQEVSTSLGKMLRRCQEENGYGYRK